MKRSLSTNGIYIGVGTTFFLFTICFNIIVFFNTESPIIRGAAIAFPLLLLLLGIILIVLLRGKLIAFSDSLNACIEDIVNGKGNVTFDLESETLTGKFNYKLQRLFEIMQNGKRQVQEEKQSIQEMISDISHQVKTPVTNLKMYNSTLLERQLTPEKEREFHKLMESQINKLDFLMQAMVKMSRLETGIITLSISPTPIYDTVGLAELQAEKKKIDIADTGRGIPEQHLAQIFKRFYREDEVHEVSGVGIGLYLCREIISKQGGYIQVKSEIGQGSTFSVFLQNKRQL